jgi:Holliday junction resolvase RusA-like endonuclease
VTDSIVRQRCPHYHRAVAAAGGRKPGKKPLKELPPIASFIDATLEFSRDGSRRIVLPYPPSVNRTYNLGVIGGRATMFLSPEAKRFKKIVQDIAVACEICPLIGKLQLTIDLYRERKAGDADPLKILFDSLEGFAYHKDSQIRRFVVNQHEDPDFPRVVVCVRLDGGETLNLITSATESERAK